VALLLGLIGARFRDMPLVVATAMQVLMFMTPVFWRPEQLTSREYVLHGNPFYYLIDSIRGPLLGHVQIESYVVLGVMAPLGWLVTLAVFNRVYCRVSYWL
jgi:ABC-type polysaccharide/polyol phosphate export permease